MKTKNLAWFCLALLGLVACSTGKSNALTVVRHLSSNGTGNVPTGTNSSLGYTEISNSITFLVSSSVSTGSLVSSAAVAFAPESTEGTAVHVITYGNVTTFNATYVCHIADHYYSSIDLTQLSVCAYSTKTELTYIAQISIDAIKLAVNAASQYLSSQGLPYIY